MAFKVPKVEKAPGEKKAKETAAKVAFKNKKVVAAKPLNAHQKRDQSITARKKNSLGKARGKR
jgi:hypothetical protein